MTSVDIHKKGYQDGREGKRQQSTEPAYIRGWKQGQLALEEAQGSFKQSRD